MPDGSYGLCSLMNAVFPPAGSIITYAMNASAVTDNMARKYIPEALGSTRHP